jgi:N4-(beta-N-acetylglucosaminyl)-L-asparaginase
VNSVGYGGLANAVGTVSLDACVMDGKTLTCGGVAGVENVRHVAALARRVMEKTPHVLLVGQGAQQFALQQGFALETLLTPESVAEWYKTRPKAKKDASADLAPEGTFPSDSHDTVTVLALDQKGSLGGVCTTSGLAHKLPGRVGDSPLIGAGLYVDDMAGAAGGTGVGEEIIRVGASLLIVEAMRAGKAPQAACEMAVQRVVAAAARRGVHPARVAFLALDPKGRFGAAATKGTGFKYAVGRKGKTELLEAKELGAE